MSLPAAETISTAPPRLTYAEMRDAARLNWTGRQQWIDICLRGRGYNGRPDAWFVEQRAALEALAQVGKEIAFIADHAQAYDAWKASVLTKNTGEAA